jgi:hypothetical protein
MQCRLIDGNLKRRRLVAGKIGNETELLPLGNRAGLCSGAALATRRGNRRHRQ